MEKLDKIIPKNMALMGIIHALSPTMQNTIRNVIEQQQKEELDAIAANLYGLTLEEYRLIKSINMLHLLK